MAILILDDQSIWPVSSIVFGNIFQNDFLSNPSLGGVYVEHQGNNPMKYFTSFYITHPSELHSIHYDIFDKIPENLQGLSPDKDIRHDQDISPAPPRVHPQQRPSPPLNNPAHLQGAQKPHVFEGRFQNTRKPAPRPTNFGLSSSLFRGNTG